MQVLQYIVDLGPSVMLPLVIFIIGLALRRGFSKSLVSGLTIGVGFVGISLVISLLTDRLGPAAGGMADRFEGGVSVGDIGWPGSSPMAWASTMGLIAIPVAIAVNPILLVTKMTRVVNVDIWNIWHMAFTGIIVQIATGSVIWGIVGVAAHAAIAYKLGDIFGPVTERYFGLEGVAIPHGTSTYMGIFAVPIDDLLNKIPGVRKINLTTEKLEKRMGVIGQPIVVGSLLGLIIGLLAGYEIGPSLQLGVQMGAVILLMPMVVKLIMQGLMPIAESARSLLQKKFKNADYRIGLDPALLLGDQQVVAAGLLFVPLTIIIAVLMPGNEMLPFGDLATIGFFIAIAVGVHRGNIFRTLISGIFIIAMTLWIATQTVQLHTQLAQDTGLLGNASRVGSLDQGGSPITYLLANGLSLQFGIGFIVIAVLFIGAFTYTYFKYKQGTIYPEDVPAETEVASTDVPEGSKK
ncbi:MAG: PTS galactitol transporter subunit IIC [Corynebacterium sp.]|uniref:PTS galactitol transporter subunit IIC n=1 Tax=Corynebacterium sp. TaxID=1720 RepID=UPI001836ECCE|nr:PTS transporter subunit IIC [Corynebacterium sp.]NWO17902.1 PTS galactitol transporter subunit IIC [Corynebacterium sp.]